MREIEGGQDLRSPAERTRELEGLTRELPGLEGNGSRWLRRLGSCFVVGGLLLLPTLIFTLWGLLAIGTGCLLRVAARA